MTISLSYKKHLEVCIFITIKLSSLDFGMNKMTGKFV